MAILPNIQGHNDLIQLNDAQRQQLCGEIREFIISHVAKTGGHLASNLGVVELTVAIETVYNTAQDRLVFDVGHQSYVHKLSTGRQADFDHLRMFGGMSGFPKPSESGRFLRCRACIQFCVHCAGDGAGKKTDRAELQRGRPNR